MSAHNGDKSRYQVNRKRAVLRRAKIRELVKAAKAGDGGQAQRQGAKPAARTRSRTSPHRVVPARQACTPGASWPVRSTYSTYEPR